MNFFLENAQLALSATIYLNILILVFLAVIE